MGHIATRGAQALARQIAEQASRLPWARLELQRRAGNEGRAWYSGTLGSDAIACPRQRLHAIGANGKAQTLATRIRNAALMDALTGEQAEAVFWRIWPPCSGIVLCSCSWTIARVEFYPSDLLIAPVGRRPPRRPSCSGLAKRWPVELGGIIALALCLLLALGLLDDNSKD